MLVASKIYWIVLFNLLFRVRRVVMGAVAQSKKTYLQYLRLAAADTGIEFAYAIEIALVVPILLKIGVKHQYMSMVWTISPCIGFFALPIISNFSDRCTSRIGRRRPFLLGLALGVVIGLILVPNGENLGYLVGDTCLDSKNIANVTTNNTNSSYADNDTANHHTWGIFFTILGVVILDFSADSSHSLTKAYMLDITKAEEHSQALSVFITMSGFGGLMGGIMGAIDWSNVKIVQHLGGDVNTIFYISVTIYIAFLLITLTSFPERRLGNHGSNICDILRQEDIKGISQNVTLSTLSTFELKSVENDNVVPERKTENITEAAEIPNIKNYFKSIRSIPTGMRRICLTEVFSWMAQLCYLLYFTDYVGESVFKGNPKGKNGSPERALFDDGVRYACWGMALYSFTCVLYSLIITKITIWFGAKRVFTGGILTYSIGMAIVAATNHPISIILCSVIAGIMYATTCYIPSLLIAHYHARNTFEEDSNGLPLPSTTVRGIGTDIGIINSMTFLAQFILSLMIGSIIDKLGTISIVIVASILSSCAAVFSLFIPFLGL